jgi:hypothetical protein
LKKAVRGSCQRGIPSGSREIIRFAGRVLSWSKQRGSLDSSPTQPDAPSGRSHTHGQRARASAACTPNTCPPSLKRSTSPTPFVMLTVCHPLLCAVIRAHVMSAVAVAFAIASIQHCVTTFRVERRVVWRAPVSYATCAFVVSRYIPILGSLLAFIPLGGFQGFSMADSVRLYRERHGRHR